MSNPTPDSVTCPHEDFHGQLNVIRLADLGEFIVEVEVHCKQCGVPFQFTGLPTAIRTDAPCVSTFGDTATLPIIPGRRRIDEIPASIPVVVRHAAEGKDVS